MLVPATTETERCPHCSNWPAPPSAASIRPEEKANDRFCSNLFACPVGARLNEATFPPYVKVCPVCASTRLPLLEQQTRLDHVIACAFCSALIGKTPDASSTGLCCLCGQSADAARQLTSDEEQWKA